MYMKIRVGLTKKYSPSPVQMYMYRHSLYHYYLQVSHLQVVWRQTRAFWTCHVTSRHRFGPCLTVRLLHPFQVLRRQHLPLGRALGTCHQARECMTSQLQQVRWMTMTLTTMTAMAARLSVSCFTKMCITYFMNICENVA